MLRISREQIQTARAEEAEMYMHLMSNEIDRCHVWFLKMACIKHREYDDALIQLIDLYSPHDEEVQEVEVLL